MKLKTAIVFFGILIITALVAGQAFAAKDAVRIVERTQVIQGSPVRIQVSLSTGQDERAMGDTIDGIFKGLSVSGQGLSMGGVIDNVVAALKAQGIANALVNSETQIYCLGAKSDKEMWKAWVPHPTDKKKVFAILRLKDKAVATVRDKIESASVVADNAALAEKLAGDLLAQGTNGLKTAEDMGLDAIIIVKDGKKLKAGMAGGFKEQYGKAK